MQILINETAVLDIPPYFSAGWISVPAQLEGGNGAGVDRAGSGFGVGRRVGSI